MTSLIWGLIEINALIIILFIGYMGIRKRLTFVQQRALLVGLPFLAIGAVLLKSLVDFSAFSYSLPLVQLDEIIIDGNVSTSAASQFDGFSLSTIYWIGALGFGLLFLIRIARVFSFFHLNVSEKQDTYRIYKVGGKSSFSFFNRIQISPELEGADKEIVLEHEKMHVDKRHSVDTIIMELVHVLFWFNPVLFFIKRELINLHEFEVDAVMYEKHKVTYLQFLVNYALGLNTSNYLLTSKFYNVLTLKKRITIMKTNYKKRSWMLLIVPMIAIIASLTQCTKDDKTAADSEEDLLKDEFVHEFADEEPQFNGGSDAMVAYISEGVNYPEEMKEQGVEGMVFVQFTVGSNGAIRDSKVLKGVHEVLDNEALRVIREMPDWIPGKKDGKDVAVKFTIPISFRLS